MLINDAHGPESYGVVRPPADTSLTITLLSFLLSSLSESGNGTGADGMDYQSSPSVEKVKIMRYLR